MLHMPTARTGTQTPPPAPQGSQNPKRGHEQTPIPAPALSSEVFGSAKTHPGIFQMFLFSQPTRTSLCFLSAEPYRSSQLRSRHPSSVPGWQDPLSRQRWVGNSCPDL